MKIEYNYNRHLYKKIDRLEDFTVEYKNDPFKAIKIFIDSYKWLKDPANNKFPEELVGQSFTSIEKYVRNVIKTTASRWADAYLPYKFVKNPPDIGFFRGFKYDNDGVYLDDVCGDYIGIGLRSHPVEFTSCSRIYFEIYLPYLINCFIGPAFIHTHRYNVFDSKEYLVSVSECLDFTPKKYICLSERDAFELYYIGKKDGSKPFDNTDILNEWEKRTFCKENYKAHGLYVTMKPDRPLVKKIVYRENCRDSIRSGIELDMSTNNNTNYFMNNFI